MARSAAVPVVTSLFLGLFCLTCFAAYATGWAVLIWTQVLVG